jgi:hypothetical protein
MMNAADYYIFAIYLDFFRNKWSHENIERRIGVLTDVANGLSPLLPSVNSKKYYLKRWLNG